MLRRLRRRARSVGSPTPSPSPSPPPPSALSAHNGSLLLAAALGNAIAVRAACSDPSTLASFSDREITTSLIAASSCGYLDVVRALLECGRVCASNELALKAACANRHPHVVDLLLRESLGLAPDNEAIAAAARGDVQLISAMLSPRRRQQRQESDDDDGDQESARNLSASPIRSLAHIHISSELLKSMHAAAVVNNKPDVVYAILQSLRARSIIDVHRARSLAHDKGFNGVVDAIEAAIANTSSPRRHTTTTAYSKPV